MLTLIFMFAGDVGNGSSDMIFAIMGDVFIISFLASIFLAKKRGGAANRSVALFGLSGRGKLDISGDELKITYHKKWLGIFQKWTGTIIYKLSGQDLLVNYEVKRETGERNIALETLYSTSVSKQKRRVLLLVLGIIVAVAAIGVTAATREFAGFVLIIPAGILILLWYFQQRLIKFSILFGGVGEAGSGFLTSNAENDEMVTAFINKLYSEAQACRDQNALKPVLKLLEEQKTPFVKSPAKQKAAAPDTSAAEARLAAIRENNEKINAFLNKVYETAQVCRDENTLEPIQKLFDDQKSTDKK